MGEHNHNIEQLLKEGKTVQVKPKGYSMYPFIVPGQDEAVVEPVRNVRLKRGDVVLYRRAETGILVLHRIMKCNDGGIYLVGDNQTEVEGPLMPDAVKGIMVGLYKKGRFVSVHNPVYRLMSFSWLVLRPFRPGISRVLSAIKKALSRGKKGNKNK